MLKDAAANDVTFGQWKISQLCRNSKEPLTGSVDIGDKKQKSWLGNTGNFALAFNWQNTRTNCTEVRWMWYYEGAANTSDVATDAHV